jgi:phosphoribosylamine--glycine ligase
MGDPETEVVVPRINNDLLDLFLHVENQTLDQVTLAINPQVAATVMLVSKGYPEAYEKGKIISNVQNVQNSYVFHAGTKLNDKGELVSNGGRVLAVTSMGASIQEALRLSYQNADLIDFENKHYRRDIGKDIL